jgi:hypothetical protein
MRSGKAILAGAAVLVALAGGGAAVLATSDGDGDDEPALGSSTLAGEPPSTEQDSTTAPAPAPDADPAPAPSPEVEPEPEVGRERAGGGQAGGDRAGGKPRETRFPRERRRDPAKTGKRFAVPPAQEFSGRGNALIGIVDVKATAVVKWRAQGNFGLEFGPESFPITAPSPRGELVIPPYRFEQVRVLAKGRWRIVITPQR